MKASEFIRAAAALPRTTKAFARDESGIAVQHDLPQAICFCAIGALGRVTEGSTKDYSSAFRFLNDALPPAADGLIRYYDTTDDAGREALWVKAISLAEQSEAA